jgi:hypothetical protein
MAVRINQRSHHRRHAKIWALATETTWRLCIVRIAVDSLHISRRVCRIGHRKPTRTICTNWRSGFVTLTHIYAPAFDFQVLTEAGGNHTTAIFNALPGAAALAPGGGNAAGVHRQLQMAAFLIGLYSLGLLNDVTPTWQSRTYSSHVSWITGQAIDIGRAAIRLLVDTWPGHLTPSEVATLADKASQTRETAIVSNLRLHTRCIHVCCRCKPPPI